MLRYQINYHDYNNGATSAWETVEAERGYTGEDFAENISKYGDEDEMELLDHGYFTTELLPMTPTELFDNFYDELTKKARSYVTTGDQTVNAGLLFDDPDEFNLYCEQIEEE